MLCTKESHSRNMGKMVSMHCVLLELVGTVVWNNENKNKLPKQPAR